MGHDTGLANRLRAAGLIVVEVAGWQTRGSSSFDPRGSVNHHTAGSANGAAPSLNTIIYGRSDLPGPLANVFQSRDPNGYDAAYVVAAGRANHAGEGGWKGLSGNSSVWGLEIEHTGTEPLPKDRQYIAARIHAAMFTGDASMVCQHHEWTTRKIDAATNVDPNEFRAWINDIREDDLPYSADQLRTYAFDGVNRALSQAGTPARIGVRDCCNMGACDALSQAGSPARTGVRDCAGMAVNDQMSAPGSASRTGVRDCSAMGANDALAGRLDDMQSQMDAMVDLLVEISSDINRSKRG